MNESIAIVNHALNTLAFYFHEHDNNTIGGDDDGYDFDSAVRVE